MKTTLLLLTALVPATWATPLIYNFSGPDVTIGTSQVFTNNGISITAYGYGSGVAKNLYEKNDGVGEAGLGIAGGSDNEIQTNEFIQLDLKNFWAANPTSVTMSIGSVQAGEGWKIFGSNTLGSIGTQIQSGTTDAPSTFVLASLASSYRYISVDSSCGDVLLSTLSASVTSTPEPASYLLIGSGLLFAGLLRRRG